MSKNDILESEKLVEEIQKVSVNFLERALNGGLIEADRAEKIAIFVGDNFFEYEKKKTVCKKLGFLMDRFPEMSQDLMLIDLKS